MRARVLLVLVFVALCSAAAALAQGFAGLGTTAEGYLAPDPATRFAFPADHGPHPGFRIEWWYLTANLTGPDGTEYGAQWTLFRSALSPSDDVPPIWMGHAALTTPKAHYAAERFARGGTGQAGVTAAPFAAWIDEWQITGIAEGEVTARGAEFGYRLSLRSDAPFVPQGQMGYSVKAEGGQASHYYSQPFYRVEGALSLPAGPDGSGQVTVPVTGLAWLDREWSSQPLAQDQRGWDWISVHLDGGAKLMGFQLRSDAAPYTTGTLIAADGTPQPIPAGGLRFTPLTWAEVAGRRLPTAWRVEVPAHQIDVEITALNPQSWMDLAVPYWEGPVRATGSHPGVGYLEMTGYE